MCSSPGTVSWQKVRKIKRETEETVATDEIRPSTRQVCGETVKVNAPMVNALFCVAL